MPTYEASTSISAPRDAVWRVLSDVVAWPQWLPTVTSIEALDSDSLRIGARYKVRRPDLRPATWIVTELQQGARFVWVSRSPGLHMLAEHAVDEDPSGALVVLRFTFSGPLAGLIGRLFRSITESYLQREAASLKQRVAASQ